jgi:hypothetical protein
MSRKLNKNTSVSMLSRADKRDISALVIKSRKKAKLREELLAELKNSALCTRQTTDERLRIETEGYLSYTVCDPDVLAAYSQNPLVFWRNHGSTAYPVLGKLASLFLGLSAGSVSVESLFSITGLVLNSRRSSMDPAKVNKICFLHDNIQFLIDNENEQESDL